MIDFILNFILSAIDLWLIEFFISKSLTQFKEKQKPLFRFIELFILFLMHIKFESQLILKGILIAIVLIISTYKYKFAKKELLLFFLTFIMIGAITKNIIIYILTWIFDMHTNNTIFTWSLSYKILIELITRYLQLLLIIYFTNRKKKSKISLHYFKGFSYFLSIYCGIVLIINDDKLFVFPSVGRTFVFVIIVYNIALICFDRFQTRHEELEYEHEQLINESSSDAIYFEEHSKGNDEIRSIRHDMKNHMLVLTGYVSSDQKETALDYIKTIEKEIDLASITFHTGIDAVDSILTSKVKEMNENNIQYNESFKVINLGLVYDRDLALMLASALDNAIEAAIKSENKKISLKISTEFNYLYVTLSNSIKKNSKPNFKKSSKEDSSRHGFGYKKMKSIVKKYNGDLFTKVTKNKVTITMTLKID